jgi:hypothetical protein
MSLASDDFTVTGLDGGQVRSGTSILLTGSDADALRDVYYGFVAPGPDERAVLLETDASGRSVKQSLGPRRDGAGDRSSVLASRGSARGDGVTGVDDLSDLTGVGMTFSSLLTDSQRATGRFRSGIFLCSTICEAVDDIRPVYRFLNSNFLAELRRGDGIGVCALDTSADVGASIDSVVAGLETSFDARLDAIEASRRHVTVETAGFDAVADGNTIDIER